jgi:hypothetical protein
MIIIATCRMYRHSNINRFKGIVILMNVQKEISNSVINKDKVANIK